MGKIILYIVLVFYITGLSAQNNSEYMMVMVKQKKALNMARTEQDFLNLAQNFERIANAETDQWHPLYYAGLCYVNMSLINKTAGPKDNYLDQAQVFIDKALEIYPDESEIYVLQGLLYQGRIQVDPAKRFSEYAKKAEEALMVAKDYNPDNPRIYYLLAMNILHTPKDAGGGKEIACKFFKTASEKFNTYLPQHVLSPTWGGERNHELYSQYCLE
jgi:tetratricopeptide (TPR) repeat protein